MKMQALVCPNCHANLDNDAEMMGTFFCKYCGQKIVVEELQDAAMKMKVREMELEHEEKKMEFEQQRQNIAFEQSLKQSRIEEKRSNKARFIGIGIGVAMMLPAFIYFGALIANHNKNIRNLQKIETEVQIAIQQQDYDLALMKANQLRLDDGYSNDATATWDEKREEYIKLIESKKAGQ